MVPIGSKRRAQSDLARPGQRPPAIPTRIELPHYPSEPARLETPVQPERPGRPPIPVESERRIKTAKPVRIVTPPAPSHVDEIGQNS